MISPQRASVRPRVYVPDTFGAILLEDQVLARLDDEDWGIVLLKGSPGSGKSAAVAHLADALGSDSRLRLADGATYAQFLKLMELKWEKLVVCADISTEFLPDRIETWRLVPWSDDEWIEYLLSVHREQCASVMQRLQEDGDRPFLEGSPALWRAVLDRLASDDTIAGVKEALRSSFHEQLPGTTTLAEAREYYFSLLVPPPEVDLAEQVASRADFYFETLPLLRYRQAQVLMAAEHVAEELRSKPNSTVLEQPIPFPLLQEVGSLIRDDLAAIEHLQRGLSDPAWPACSMGASLLHAAGVPWCPEADATVSLGGAYLEGVRWHGIQLRLLEITKADFSRADLSEARIDRVQALHANLSQSNWHGTFVGSLSAEGAALIGADLSFLRSPGADFHEARLVCARLDGALISKALFCNADLRQAKLRRTDLYEAEFLGASIAGADFTGANLSYSDLSGLTLREATFNDAQFCYAVLQKCDLEMMRLPGANFEGADLTDSHLTGSQMPYANFRNANLRSTGLAEIEWEGADLRNADLRNSTFHLGSSRSGLVGSPIACEGSRTGFYTDDESEQDFKAPEEIRKANLCRADLRGAKIDNVDFYLVDLRGAIYTAEQEDHFRHCRAILETRV